MLTSQVRPLGGVPTLFIDGGPVPGIACITYFRERACYAEFGEAGYRLFSIPVFFGDQSINPNSLIAAGAGAHVYNDTGDAVWASAHYAVLHAAAAGERSLRLPCRRRVRPVLPDGAPFTAETLTEKMRLGETRVWRLD